MTQAPDLIWANSSYKDNHAYGWWRDVTFEAGEVYIRKDIVDKRISDLEASLRRMTYLQIHGPAYGVQWAAECLKEALDVLKEDDRWV